LSNAKLQGGEILAAEYGVETTRPNVIRVTGSTSNLNTTWSEAIDTANLLLTGDERVKLMVDRMLDTSAKCRIKAAQELRVVQREAVHGTLAVAINPQHELGDVITFSDAAFDLASTAMRINAMVWTYRAEEATFDQLLHLEAP
jgi:hypothetical protein